MSLVGDALRRARAEAGERRGVAIPPGLGPPIRRSLLGGPAAVVVALVLVATGAASVTWWLVGSRGDAPSPATAAAVAGDETVASGTDLPARDAAPEKVDASAAIPGPKGLPAADDRATAVPESPATAGPALPSPPLQAPETAARTSAGGDTSVAAPSPADAASRPAAAERSFVIDAELGYARLHLDYLVYKPSAPFARVNGRDVVVGSIVDGFKVEEIGPDFVRLADGRGPVTLRVR